MLYHDLNTASRSSTPLRPRPAIDQSWKTRWRAAGLSVLCTGSLLLAGCSGGAGEPLAEVSGRVTRGGQPLGGANVMFIPQAGQGAPSGGVTDAGGAFELTHSSGSTGALPGSHRVVISVAGEEPPPPEAGSSPPSRQAPAPEFYKQAEVTPDGDNHFLFEVMGGSS